MSKESSLTPPPIISEFKSGEIVPREPFTVSEIQAGLERVGGTILHTHFEGIFTPVDIEGMFARLSIQLPPEIIESMRTHMSPAESKKDLAQFIGRLSTRWLRAGLMHGIMNGMNSEEILAEYFKTALDKVYAQGVVNLELMTALLNMTLEGDLSDVPMPFGSQGTAEAELISSWNIYVQQATKAGTAAETIPTIRTYLKTMKRVITSDSKFRWGDEPARVSGRVMRVAPVVQIRRDQKNDRMLMNDRTTMYPEVGQAGRPIAEELVHCFYGVDEDGPLYAGINMAGIEDRKHTELHHFSALFQLAAYHGIPINVHAGEISLLREWLGKRTSVGDIEKMDKAQMAELVQYLRKKKVPPNVRRGFNNLHYAINNRAIGRIGHAVLLMRHSGLLRQALEQGKALELCAESNDWTYVSTPSNHDLLSALKGDLAIMAQDPALHELLVLQTTPHDDDAVIFDTNYTLAEEIYRLCAAVNNLGFTNVDDLLIWLRDAGEGVAVWHKPRHERRPKMFPHDNVASAV